MRLDYTKEDFEDKVTEIKFSADEGGDCEYSPTNASLVEYSCYGAVPCLVVTCEIDEMSVAIKKEDWPIFKKAGDRLFKEN